MKEKKSMTGPAASNLQPSSLCSNAYRSLPGSQDGFFLLFSSIYIQGQFWRDFWGFQKPLRICPSMTMGIPFFSYKVSRGIHSVLNSGVAGFCFEFKLRNLVSKTFFWSSRRKIGDLRKNLCCSITGNSAPRSHYTCTVKIRDKRLFGNYSEKSLELPVLVYGNSL